MAPGFFFCSESTCLVSVMQFESILSFVVNYFVLNRRRATTFSALSLLTVEPRADNVIEIYGRRGERELSRTTFV